MFQNRRVKRLTVALALCCTLFVGASPAVAAFQLAVFINSPGAPVVYLSATPTSSIVTFSIPFNGGRIGGYGNQNPKIVANGSNLVFTATGLYSTSTGKHGACKVALTSNNLPRTIPASACTATLTVHDLQTGKLLIQRTVTGIGTISD
jgi:hypothetical protein